MSSYAIIHRSGYDGHHLFRDLSNGRLVICDHSNDNEYGDPGDPEGGDDGLHYVDFTRPLTVYSGTQKPPVYSLPMVNADGDPSNCLSQLVEVHRIEAIEKRRFG